MKSLFENKIKQALLSLNLTGLCLFSRSTVMTMVIKLEVVMVVGVDDNFIQQFLFDHVSFQLLTLQLGWFVRYRHGYNGPDGDGDVFENYKYPKFSPSVVLGTPLGVEN